MTGSRLFVFVLTGEGQSLKLLIDHRVSAGPVGGERTAHDTAKAWEVHTTSPQRPSIRAGIWSKEPDALRQIPLTTEKTVQVVWYLIDCRCCSCAVDSTT